MEIPSYKFPLALAVRVTTAALILLPLFFANVLSISVDFKEDIFTIVAAPTADDNHFNGSPRLYVGGNDVVHMLDENLQKLSSRRLNRSGSTSGDLRENSCNNRVVVLEVDRQLSRLLACGAGDSDDDDGQLRCWFLGLENLTIHGSFSSPFYADVGSQSLTSSPIVFRQINNADRKGNPSTRNQEKRRRPKQPGRYSRWIVVSPYSRPSSKSIVSLVKITENSSSGNGPATYKLDVERSIRKCNQSVKFDVVDGFCHESKCFFLTLQQKSLSKAALISRMASVCSDYLLPYLELSFDRAKNKENSATAEQMYDRSLMFALGFPNTSVPVVVSVFGNASSLTKGFGVALSNLSKFENERQKTIAAIDQDKDLVPDWNNGTDCSPVSDRSACSNSSKLVIRMDTGDAAELKINVSHVDKDIGHVTALFTHTVKNKESVSGASKRMIIYVTMSTGLIYKFALRVGSSGQFDLKRVEHYSDTVQASNQRRGVAIAGPNFYLLSGTKVEGMPLDYCQSLDTCYDCKNTSGCTWCRSNGKCLLTDKCLSDKGKACLPSITKVVPASGPVSGRTRLSVTGWELQTYHATVFICERECNNSTSTVYSVECDVPKSVEEKPKDCNVTVNVPKKGNFTAATSFRYTFPVIRDFSPHRLLQSEGGDVEFKGDNLDTGSHPSVEFISEHGDVECRVIERKRHLLRCRLANETRLQRDTGYRDASDEGRLETGCYNATVTIDSYSLPIGDQRPLCLRPNPSVLSIAHNTTFVSGSVALTVNGIDLDLAFVDLRLSRNGTQSNSSRCEDCKDVADGSCIVCCTPDVTSLTSSVPDDVTANVSFTLTSFLTKDEIEFDTETTSQERFAVEVVRNPKFQFDGLPANDKCLVISGDGTLKIKASFLPATVPFIVKFGGRTIPSCGPGADATPFSFTIHCNLANFVKQVFHDSDNDAVVSCDGGGGGGGGSNSFDNDLGEDTKVQVLVYGRPFPVGCAQLDLHSVNENQLPRIIIVAVVVGVSVTVVAVLLLAIFCSYKKRQSLRNPHYHAQYSVASSGMLLPSDSGGSYEPVFVSVERVLNPTGDRQKQKEIQKSGLIIQRKRLNLGDVIGHGNFGCVFEGHYQTIDGDESSWQMVAIKTLLDPATHAIDIKSFVDEAMLMKDFDHEHVMSLLGLSDGDRGPLVVLPYMDRGDLLAYVKNEATVLSIGDVLKFARDIASGMDYLAFKKFVHRDLAARNCMLDEQLNVKVADFGLCRDVYEKGYYRSDNKKKLPIRWMAAESIETGTYTPKSDVWSLGVVFWEMTTRGTTPYPGVEGWDILRHLVAGRRLIQPYFCPDALYALMERCWKGMPLERPTFREIEQDLISLNESLQEPAATNALFVGTLISLPDCHRFKDDEDIMRKVKDAMRNMSHGTDSHLAASISTSNTNSPQLSPTAVHDSSTASSSVFAPNSPDSGNNNNTSATTNKRTVATPGTAAGTFPFPPYPAGTGLCDPRAGHGDDPRCARPMRAMMASGATASTPATVVRRLAEGADPGHGRPPVAGQDDGYFLLERQDTDVDDVTVSAATASGGPVQPSSASPLISRRQPQQQPPQGAAAEPGSRAKVSFYNRQQLRDTAGKDDGYQYFELEPEVDSSKL